MNTPNEGARLIANNVLQATQTQGLVAVVRHQIETTLSDLVGVLLSKAACDFRRVLRPVGEQTHSINIEPYHGHQTWARFRTEIAGCESLVALDKIIQENQISFEQLN